MSIPLLRQVKGVVLTRCREQNWVDVKTGRQLQPAEVNLYQFAYYHIWPTTLPRGVTLRGLKASVFQKGAHVVQYGTKDPRQCGQDSEIVAEGRVRTSGSGTAVEVTVDRGQFSLASMGNYTSLLIEGQECGEVSRVEASVDLSYKEMLCPRPCVPEWYCSHWWGNPVLDFIVCCEEHARLRALSDERATYWICAYANRQNALDSELSENPLESSFLRALEVSKGVLLHLDSQATPFRRIWCCFELYMISAQKREKTLDIVTMNLHEPKLLADGCLPAEAPGQKIAREHSFPHELLVEGLRARLQDGETTLESDAVRILNCMVRSQDEGTYDIDDRSVLERSRNMKSLMSRKSEQGQPTCRDWSFTRTRSTLSSVRRSTVARRSMNGQTTSNDVDELERSLREEEQEKYNQINAALHSQVALLAWPQAVGLGNVRDFDASRPGTASLPILLKEDVNRKDMQLAINRPGHLTDADLIAIADGLPPYLDDLDLRLTAIYGRRSLLRGSGSNSEVTDVGAGALALALPAGLRSLLLCLGNSAICDEGMAAIAGELPHELEKLALLLFGGRRLGDGGLESVMTKLPPRVSELTLVFSHCSCITDTGVDLVARNLPQELRKLSLGFEGCEKVTDASFTRLVASLPSSLEELSLDVGPNVTDAFADALAASFRARAMPALRHLVLRFIEGTVGVTRIGLQGLGAAIPLELAELEADFLGTSAKCDFSVPQDFRAWAAAQAA